MTNKELFRTIYQLNEGSGLRILNYVNWKELTLVQKVIVCIMQPVVFIVVPCIIIVEVITVICVILCEMLFERIKDLILKILNYENE